MSGFDKQQVIADNIAARENEIAMYDLNITNYRYVLEMPNEPAMATFIKEVRDLLASEIYQRRKAEIILMALRAQA